jgi:uncharacterized repeat protein (TIGR04052 family)
MMQLITCTGTLCTSLLLTATFMTALPARAEQEVTLRFLAEVGGKPFACGQSYSGVGTAAASITPADFRLYLSSVALVDAEGKTVPLTLQQDEIWQYQNVALLDFEDGSGPCQNGNTPINTNIHGSVPDGDYRGVQFTLGLPFALNHADNLLAASPLNLSAMFWNWQGGYRFFKVDLAAAQTTGMGGGMHMGATAAAAGEPMDKPMHAAAAEAGGHGNGGFLVHLGSTGCASAASTAAPATACANPNTVSVTFADFDATADSIVIDLASLLQFSDVTSNTEGTSPGCMSAATDPECAPIFRGFGLDGSPQQLFRVK